MKKRIIVALGVIALLACSAAAQKLEPPTLDPTPSTERQSELIKEGVALHDRGDYDGAVSRYDEVLRENPNNISALYEMSYSYFMKKDYQKSLDTAYRAAQYKSNVLSDVYVTIGNCFDELGEPRKAIETYKTGIKLLAPNFFLHYNLAVTYNRTGQLDEARAAVKRSAALNPAHPSSQLLLSTLFDKGSYKTPALLAACRFLILEPASQRSDTALRLVGKTMQAGVSPGKNANEINIFLDTSPQKKDEGDFSSIDVFMGLARAANYTEKNKGKNEMQLLVANFESLFAFLSESTSKADRSKFTWQYYVPYFVEMKNKGHVEAFAYYINQRGSTPGVDEWLQRNQNKVLDFLTWSKNYQWPKID
jgi:Tfp pilus assembly protein PilF